MNPKEYISWGILESYVLGSLDEDEARDVEQKLAAYPELRAELSVIRVSLEKYSSQFCVVPDPGLKEAVLGPLRPPAVQEGAEARNKGKRDRKKQGGDAQEAAAGKGKALAWTLSAIAVLVALVSAVAAYHYQQEWQKAETKITSLEHERVSEAGNISTTKNTYEEKARAKDSLISALRARLSLLLDTNTRIVELKGTTLSPASHANIVWKKDGSGELYIMHPTLPVPPEGKQYQLWASVKGGYADAGVLEISDTLTIQQMKSVTEADGFEVSLEEKGGSASPNTKELYLKGKL